MGREEMLRPRVDVIVPTYKPDEKFRRLMEMLREQTYPVNKIIIMNTGTELPDEEHYRKHLVQEAAGGHVPMMEVNHLAAVAFDHGGTRNAGTVHSDAEICLFMTQDAVPENAQLIEKLVAPFLKQKADDPVVAVSYARQLPAEDCRLAEQFTRSFNYPPESRLKTKGDLEILGIKTFFCSNVCAAYRMDIFRQEGGFEERTIFNEDMIFAGHLVKKGYAIAYAADARVVHSHNYSNTLQFHRNFDLAVSQAQHPEVFADVRSESEGIRLVKRTAAHLIKQKKPHLVLGLIVTSGCKYMGYWLGKRYRKLPMWLVKKLSWNKRYWEKG